jgi:hypothetical protein
MQPPPAGPPAGPPSQTILPPAAPAGKGRFAFKHEDFPALGADKKAGQGMNALGLGGPGSTDLLPGNVFDQVPLSQATLEAAVAAVDTDSVENDVESEIKTRFGHLSIDLRKGLKDKLIKERMEAQKKAEENGTQFRHADFMRFQPSDDIGQFGLLGLLRVIRMTEADLNMLALGMDLTKLGLNLNSPNYLSQTFRSPWSDTPLPSSDPEYWLPPSYYVHPTPIKHVHLGRFTVDTVFYLFHNMPGDVLQTHAAYELCLRGWRYHTEIQLWVRTVEDVTGRVDGRNQWIYFDPQSWEKRFYMKQVEMKHLLAVEDCQVKSARFVEPR